MTFKATSQRLSMSLWDILEIPEADFSHLSNGWSLTGQLGRGSVGKGLRKN